MAGALLAETLGGARAAPVALGVEDARAGALVAGLAGALAGALAAGALVGALGVVFAGALADMLCDAVCCMDMEMLRSCFRWKRLYMKSI